MPVLTLGDLGRYGIQPGAGGSSVRSIRVYTGTGNITVSDDDDIIEVNKSVGAATGVILPAVPEDGKLFTIKDGKGDASTHNITITVSGSGDIDGGGSFLLDMPYQAANFLYSADNDRYILI